MKLNVETQIDHEPCPECGEKRKFTAKSQRVAEDCCEIWAECRCGHETNPIDRREDVWGSLDLGTVLCLILDRDRAIQEVRP